jgi:squalene-associated FAD-dependent desaturase
VPDATATRVAVIGGGWAGCAAAVTLAAAGVPVTLFEQARTLGGRARRVERDGIALDNGQHLVIGAYRQTLALLATVHRTGDADALFHRLPLTLRTFGGRRPGGLELAAWSAPAPLHVAGGVLAAQGLNWRERLALLADFRRITRAESRGTPDESVARCLARTSRRTFAGVWKPLCLAALNTVPERASARMFAHVLRAAFTGSNRHSDFLVPAVDLSTCFPDAAAQFIVRRGGVVRSGVAARVIGRTGDAVALRIGADAATFAAAVVAVGPHQLATTVGAMAASEDTWRVPLERVGAFAYESITTLYFGFAGRVAFGVPLLRLDDAPGHWAFDRSAALGSGAARGGAQSLIAVVISAGGPHDALDHATLAARVESQLRRLAPDLPATTFAHVIAERRATYACTPGLARPAAGRVGKGVYLAGDYTDPVFPATLEAATRSGVAAACALIADGEAGAAARGSTRAP